MVEQIKALLTDRGEKPLIFAMIAFLFLATVLVGTVTNLNTAYAVMIDGKQVALVLEEQVAHDLLEEMVDEKSEVAGQAVAPREAVIVEQVKSKGDRITDKELAELFEEKITFSTAATAIVIDGQEKLVVENMTVAQDLLQEAKDSYLQVSDDMELVQVDIEEKIDFRQVVVDLGGYADYESALALLLHGTERLERHTVEPGESMWTIAQDNSLVVDDLLEANPQLTPHRLSIGEEINLIKVDPMLNVVASVRQTQLENISFDTKYQNTSNMYRGQEKVTQSGERGQREVVYQMVQVNGVTKEKTEVESSVVKEPVERVISRGTKVLVASRGSGEVGRLGWPVSGRITSGYGNRSGGFHAGIDIAASTGTSIRAADAGVVTFSGYSGAYGNRIDIDHGAGVTTRYAHNSANLVQVGQRVSGGEVIGRVGSTGRSTGPHVHFEVRVNGRTNNPMNYLP